MVFQFLLLFVLVTSNENNQLDNVILQLHFAISRYSQALEHLSSAWEIREHVLGPDHVSFSTVFHRVQQINITNLSIVQQRSL